MGSGDGGIAAIAGDPCLDADAQGIEQGLHRPEFAGDVVLADQVDGRTGRRFRRAGADHVIEEGLAADAVAEVLAAPVAGAVHRDHRQLQVPGGGLADGVDVLADQGGDAGGVDEDRRRGVLACDRLDGLAQFRLSAEDDVVLAQVGGEAATVQMGARGEAAAGAPGVTTAGDRAMDQMGGIGDGHQGDQRTVEGAPALGVAWLRLLPASPGGSGAPRAVPGVPMGGIVRAGRFGEQSPIGGGRDHQCPPSLAVDDRTLTTPPAQSDP